MYLGSFGIQTVDIRSMKNVIGLRTQRKKLWFVTHCKLPTSVTWCSCGWALSLTDKVTNSSKVCMKPSKTTTKSVGMNKTLTKPNQMVRIFVICNEGSQSQCNNCCQCHHNNMIELENWVVQPTVEDVVWVVGDENNTCSKTLVRRNLCTLV